MTNLVSAAYLVAGQPHILLAHDKSPAWKSLYESYARIREEIAASDADVILYFSTQWLSVLGYMFQGDPAPSWRHVDANWHEFGSIDYKFRVDQELAKAYAKEVSRFGFNTSVVNYRGFPIDTGTIVAQKLLNPDNRLPAAMVSCNMYAEKEESIRIGQAAAHALAAVGKKAIVVLVSSLSNRFEIKDIDPKSDKISSLKDDEWNQKILELLGNGALEDVSQCAREFARQANADMGFKGIWWLNGLCGQSNAFKGKVFDYQPVWGTGAALVGLYPTKPVVPSEYESSSEEGSQAQLVANLTERGKEKSAETDSATAKTSAHAVMPVVPTKADAAFASSKAPEPVGAYPHARRHGDLLFLAGIGPRQRGSKVIPGVTLDERGNVIAKDIEEQTRSVFSNVKAILEECGSSLAKVIDVQVFLTDMKSDFPKFNAVYAEYFNAKDGPTRTTVEVGSLPTPIAVEFKVIARV